MHGSLVAGHDPRSLECADGRLAVEIARFTRAPLIVASSSPARRRWPAMRAGEALELPRPGATAPA
jgi:hypothetical protein